MVPTKFQDKFGATIHLTKERWKHIVSRHPEMEQYFGEIAGTLVDPDAIIESGINPATKLFHKSLIWLWWPIERGFSLLQLTFLPN